MSMPNQPDCPNKPYQPPPVNLEPFAYCVDKPGNFIPKHDKKITELLRKVLCEDRHDKAIRAQDAALTAENPRIREQLNTIDICEELKEVKHQEQLEEKRRIQLHENSHDLRKLKLQILAAHTTMYQTQAAALHFQKHRKEYEERKKASAETRVQLQVEDDRGSISLKETNDQKAQFRCDMLEQMAYRQHKLDLERQEKQEDRRRMLETIAQYEKEMEDARQKANQHKKETNLMIEQYLKERQELKQKAREEMLEELRKIEAEQRKMENRQEQDKGEKQRKLAQKMEVCTAMILNLNKIKEDKLYRENQLFDLLVAEKNANEEMSFRKSQIENLQFRKKFNIEYKDHIQKRKMEERAKRLENERICQERIKMLEQMKQEEREQAAELAIKKKEFLGEIQSMIMQNRQEKFNQQVEERESNKYLADLQKKFDDEVAQERLRLLKSEKPELLKYMQPGSLTPSEIVELGLKRPSEKLI